MEKMKCKCCNGEEHSLLFEGKDRLHGLAGEFKLFTCSKCGVVAVRPQLSEDEIERFYPEDYISYPDPIENEISRFKKIDRQYGVIKRRKKIEKYTKKKEGRILDIGCATGIFLNEMKMHGWDAYGVEPSDYAANVAVNQLGLNIFNGYLDETNFDDHYFDVITLWDVFEHLPDPDETLRIIKRILKPNGNLVITMPNADSWERKIFKQYWAGWDIPRHYHIFSKKAIERLLSVHGMRIDGLISFTGMLGAIRISLDFWLQDRKFSEQKKRWLKKIYYSPIFRLFLYPYTIASNLFSKSTSMTLFVSNDLSSKNNS
jgi:SAM-dependent methyltransferase